MKPVTSDLIRGPFPEVPDIGDIWKWITFGGLTAPVFTGMTASFLASGEAG